MDATVCIVYCEDGISWFEYFDNYLRRVFPDIKITPLKDADLRQRTSLTRSAMQFSKINIFIVSPGFLQLLIENTHLNCRDLTSGDGKVIIFLCGASMDDFNLDDTDGRKIINRFPKFHRENLLSYPDHDKMLEQSVSLLESSSDSSRDHSDPSKRKGNDKRKKKNSKSLRFKFIPKEVQCEGNSEVIISFEEALTSEEQEEVNVEVEIADDIDDDEPTRVKAVWQNPYTYSFKAPERRAGSLKAQVFVQGKISGSEELTYSSRAMDAIVGIHQIYIRELNELCDVLKSNYLLTPSIDERLSKILNDHSDCSIPANAFEYFHGVYRYQNSDMSVFELPTMFHLAAKYDLKELGKRLTDLPDARHSYCIFNAHQKLPEEIAKQYDHHELATKFENFREGETFQDMYDTYMIMGRSRNPNQTYYLNSERATVEKNSDDDDYDYEDVPSETDMKCMSFPPKGTNIGVRGVAGNASNVAGAAARGYSEAREVPYGEPISITVKDVEEMENPYQCRFQNQRLAGQSAEGIASIPRNQHELICIMEQVKKKQLSLTEAEVLFKEWKLKYEKKSSSIKQKENMLAKMREENEKKMQKEKKDGSPLQNLYSKKAAVPQIMPGAGGKKPGIKTAKMAVAEVNTDRSSTTSSSSRESTCSRASTTSGVDIDETIPEESVPKLKKRNRPQSICLQKLSQELSSPGALVPPPIPPRVIPPSIPLPKIEFKASRGGNQQQHQQPSPDGSYLECDLDQTCVSTNSDDNYMLMEGASQLDVERSDSRSVIHQQSLPEVPNPPWVTVPRKGSLPDMQIGAGVGSKKFPPVPEEDSDEGTHPKPSVSVPSGPMGFQISKQGILAVKLKLTQSTSKPKPKTDDTSSEAIRPEAVLKPVAKRPPGVPKKTTK